MSTSPSIPAASAPKTSWLTRFGQAVAKILGIAAKGVSAAEPIVDKVAVPLAEVLLPQFTPEIQMAASWAGKAFNLILLNESTFQAVGQASNGPAKLQAVLDGIGADFDAWVTGSFPGGAELMKEETFISAKAAYLTNYVNETVAFLNKFQGSTTVQPTASAVAAASAAAAAVSSAKA